MKTIVVTFAATGGVAIEAETEDEAITKFNEMRDEDLLNELNANGIEMTAIFEED